MSTIGAGIWVLSFIWFFFRMGFSQEKALCRARLVVDQMGRA
jgi:hypothetical protein